MPQTMIGDLAKLVAASHEENFAWALGCCGRNRRDAEEVLQTVYLKVLDGRARFDGRSTLRTWLFAVIRRTAAQHRRTAWLHRRRTEPLVEVPAVEEATAEDDGRMEDLTRALKRLSRRQREVLLLVFYHDHTIEQAAEILGIGLGSARTHYERGKARLRALLGGER